MALPNRQNLIIWWQDPANVTPFNLASGGSYTLQIPHLLNWWVNTAPVSDSVSISINQHSEPVIFLWGSASNFSEIPTSEILKVDNYNISGHGVSMGLKIECGDWDRAGLLIAEVSREIDSNPTTCSLDDIVQLVISLIGTVIPRGSLLSPSSAKGLYGELVLLDKLLDIAFNADNAATQSSVLDSWHGHRTPAPGSLFGARRDFMREGNDVVIEVKTTGNDSREHRITNYLQLIEDNPDGEHLYLFSVSAKYDSTGTTNLPEMVDQIMNKLTSHGLKNRFSRYLNAYGGTGYYHSHATYYQNLENRLLVNIFSSELFDLRNVDYFDGTQFSAGAPIHSSEYGYLLMLPDGLEVTNTDSIFLSLIC